MIGTLKLVGLYVQPDQERDIKGQRSPVTGFAVEIIEVEDREKPGGSHVFEGRTLASRGARGSTLVRTLPPCARP